MRQDKEYSFQAAQLEGNLRGIAAKGVTQLTVHDPAITSSRDKFLVFLEEAYRDAPDMFYTFFLEPRVIERTVCSSLSKLFCSVQFPFRQANDKRSVQKSVELLNQNNIVFGIDLFFADEADDTIRLFRERLDIVVNFYPNHIDFPQIEAAELSSTAGFSTKDIRSASECAFACSVFYSAGRAVPWFLCVLKPLRMNPSKFFADFAEWLRCNNSSAATGFDPYGTAHTDLERMQLLFLQLKYEEKEVAHLFLVVREVVRLNGAFSRLVGEGQESELELEFCPDDLLSPCAMDVARFADTVCMEHCRVRVFVATNPDGTEYPDYKVL